MITPSTHMRIQIAPGRWSRSTTHPPPFFCTGATQVPFPHRACLVSINKSKRHTDFSLSVHALKRTLLLHRAWHVGTVLRAPHKVHSPLQVDPQFLAPYPADPGGVCTSTPETCSGRGYGTGSKGCGCDLMVRAARCFIVALATLTRGACVVAVLLQQADHQRYGVCRRLYAAQPHHGAHKQTDVGRYHHHLSRVRTKTAHGAYICSGQCS